MTNFTKLLAIISVVFSLSLSSFVLHADPGGHGNSGSSHANGNGHANKGVNKPTKYKAANHKFNANDENLISNYYNANPMGAAALPPGIAKNLARGKPLPPGIAKRNLPPGLLSTLPHYPGFEYLAVGNDVVLVNESTKVVVDILSNILK